MSSTLPIIAIVDNDLSLLKALERLVRAFGYQAETYSSAEDYLIRPAQEQVACLLLDINLDGMSGLALQKQLRFQFSTSLPIIFISGRDDIAAISEAIDDQCVAYLHKPVDATTLRSLLDQVVHH